MEAEALSLLADPSLLFSPLLFSSSSLHLLFFYLLFIVTSSSLYLLFLYLLFSLSSLLFSPHLTFHFHIHVKAVIYSGND